MLSSEAKPQKYTKLPITEKHFPIIIETQTENSTLNIRYTKDKKL